MKMICLDCKTEYDENEMMHHLTSSHEIAANIAPFIFELHKRIEKLEKGD
jgi:hypothetical protein